MFVSRAEVGSSRRITPPGRRRALAMAIRCGENEAPVTSPAISLQRQQEHHPCDSKFFRYIPQQTLPEKFDITNASPENPIWLEGDFICSPDGMLQIPPLPGAGDLCRQGYSNYWGKIRYTYQFDGIHRYLCGIFNGIAAVKVNGIDCGILTPDGRLEIISAAVDGKNSVEIELSNTAQNLLDPDNPPVSFGISAILLAD